MPAQLERGNPSTAPPRAPHVRLGNTARWSQQYLRMYAENVQNSRIRQHGAARLPTAPATLGTQTPLEPIVQSAAWAPTNQPKAPKAVRCVARESFLQRWDRSMRPRVTLVHVARFRWRLELLTTPHVNRAQRVPTCLIKVPQPVCRALYGQHLRQGRIPSVSADAHLGTGGPMACHAIHALQARSKLIMEQGPASAARRFRKRPLEVTVQPCVLVFLATLGWTRTTAGLASCAHQTRTRMRPAPILARNAHRMLYPSREV